MLANELLKINYTGCYGNGCCARSNIGLFGWRVNRGPYVALYEVRKRFLGVWFTAANFQTASDAV